MLRIVLTTFFDWIPVIFGVGFLAPVIAAFLAAFGQPEPFGYPAIWFGLALGFTWGLTAKLTGRWF